jgi:cell division septum initiation protein DivIVA
MSSIIETRRPEFAIGIRGYDRVQVDDYVERLHRLLEDAEDRARQAESEVEFSAHASVGPRVTEIFELAMQEAKELRGDAEREARDVLAVARANANEIVEEAQAQAERLAADARQDHEEMLVEFARERERMRQSLAELEERRTSVLSALRRLHETLGSAAGLASGQAAAMIDTAATTAVIAAGSQPFDGDGEAEELETRVLPQPREAD